MRQIKVKINIKALLEYLICFLMIYLSGSAAISTNEDASIFRILSISLIGFCLAYDLVYIKSIKSIKCAIFVLCCGILYLIIECLIYRETILGLVLRLLFVVVFVMVLCSDRVDVERFFQCVYRIVISIAVITLIMFLGVNIFKINIPYEYVANGTDPTFYRSYLGFFYTAGTYLRDFPLTEISIYRLQSFFWEPGVYAVYLVYALFYFVYVEKNKSKFHIAVLLLSIALTFSTTGICIGIALFSIYWFDNIRINKLSKIFMFIPIVLVVAVAIMIVWTTKRVESSHVTGSYYLRRQDLIEGLRLMLQKPLLGWGYKNYYVFEIAQNLGRGCSNGLVTLGYTMGIVGLGIVLFPFFSSVYLSVKRIRLRELVFLIVFVLTNMTEPLILMPFMIFLVVYQYRKCVLLRKYRNTTREINGIRIISKVDDT